MRLIFIHGMRQEGLDPVKLSGSWDGALRKVWETAKYAPGMPKPEMPYYGDVLDTLTRELSAKSEAVARGETVPPSQTEVDLIDELARANGVTDAEIMAEFPPGAVEKGPANWGWVQAAARALEKRVPALRGWALRFVEQVDAYLTRPHIKKAVDDIVGPVLKNGGPAIVIAHSLGTIIAYRLLRNAGAAVKTPLLITLGSPLGINAVKDRIQPPKPLMRPEGVARWINGNDPRDYVALYEKLGGAYSGGVEDVIDFRNRQDDAHQILDYLTDKRIAEAVHKALTARA